MAPAFLRARYLVPAAIGAAIFPFVVPMNDGPLGKALVIGVVWLVLAFGLHSFAELAGMLRKPAPRDVPWTPPAATTAPTGRSTPQLDEADQAQVAAIVALLRRAGVFLPAAPAPAHLFEATADQGPPVDQASVLTALHEAVYYHDEFDSTQCMANLACHDINVEQDDEMLETQILDLVRLSRGALVVTDTSIDLQLLDGPEPLPDCTITMRVNGARRSVTYAPAGKYLSTHLHVMLALAMREADPARRLAWLWTDQGVWMTAITADALSMLRDGPGATAGAADGWEWIDDAEPIAAGDYRAS